MTILEIADDLLRMTNGDGRAAVILALGYCSSGGYLRAAPMVIPELQIGDNPEPLDVAQEQNPNG